MCIVYGVEAMIAGLRPLRGFSRNTLNPYKPKCIKMQLNLNKLRPSGTGQNYNKFNITGSGLVGSLSHHFGRPKIKETLYTYARHTYHRCKFEGRQNTIGIPDRFSYRRFFGKVGIYMILIISNYFVIYVRR